MKRLLLCSLLALATPAGAQSLDLTLDTGRVYNYATGEWVTGTTTGMEYTHGPWTLGGFVIFDRSLIEHDYAFGWDREVGRLTVRASVSMYRIPDAFGWQWSSGLKFRLWSKP